MDGSNGTLQASASNCHFFRTYFVNSNNIWSSYSKHSAQIVRNIIFFLENGITTRIIYPIDTRNVNGIFAVSMVVSLLNRLACAYFLVWQRNIFGSFEWIEWNLSSGMRTNMSIVDMENKFFREFARKSNFDSYLGVMDMPRIRRHDIG